MENITYDDGFKSCSHDDHLSSLDDLIASDSQENDSFEDPHAHSHQYKNKNFILALWGLCASDGL